MSLFHTLITPFLKLGFSIMSKRKLPKISGELDLYGLKDPVKVIRDTHGIPHLTATNEEDLFLAQGFVHAQDRLWQMELNRRVATGTLAELFGELAVDTDRLTRTLGFARLGKQDWELQSEEAKTAVKAYVKGINQYLNSLDTPLPLEFSLAKAGKPKQWTVDDCMAISRLILFQLSHAWQSEITRSQLVDAVGAEHASLLEIQYHEDNPIKLPKGIEFNIFQDDGSLKAGTSPFIQGSVGSNGWVISKELSKTGSPILANDMHLAQNLPSLWYAIHLKASDKTRSEAENINISGVSFPGLPMILVGHNNSIAWGMTLSYIDVQDLYLEKLSDDGEQYLFEEEWEDLEVISEIIKVKDGINVQQKVKISHHGPIISDFMETQENIALQSKSLQPVPSLTGWYQLNKAQGWDEFVSAIKLIEAPALNVVYADSENIGYYCSGRCPTRPNSDGRLPMPGWTGEYEWGDDIPFEEMPHALNPEEGYIITCNNKIITDDYKYAHHLGQNYMNGFRARRLEIYFEENELLGFEESKNMQMDMVSTAAPLFLSHFDDIEVKDPNPTVEQAFKRMMEWKEEAEVTADSVGASLYHATRHMTARLLLEPHLGEELTNKVLGDGFHPILLPSSEFYTQDITILLRLLDDEDNWWITHAGGKERLLVQAFKRGFELLMGRLGTNIDKWTWGSIHTLTFDHSFAVQPPMDRVFNRGPYAVGGDSDTPAQFSLSHNFGGEIDWAPSWRQIVDLGDVTRSIACYAPGQSGQLGSKHYDDLIKLWREGDYFPMYWTRGQIENNSEGELTLNPQLR